MVGVDFDIEGGQTQAQINNLIAGAVYAQSLYPNLRFSFTLATLAASDGSYGGLNGVGDMVVHAVKASSLQNYTINLMVMDYGSASPGVCVVSGGKCDMGQSAIQAALNLEHTYGIAAQPYRADADDRPQRRGQRNLHRRRRGYRERLRGQPGHGRRALLVARPRHAVCGGNSGYASPTCNSVGGTTSLQYTKRFLHDLGR